MAKGNFIEYVVSDNPDKYPNDGEQGDYYYELVTKPSPVLPDKVDGALIFYSEEPFRMCVTNKKKNWNGTLQYSLDNSSWSEWNGEFIDSNNDGVIYMRGVGSTYLNTKTVSFSGAFHFETNPKCFVHCIGSMDDLLDYTTTPTLSEYCYYYIFYRCSNLITAPELPATTMAIHCYDNMFQGCTSLTTAPELPATTLANQCYYYMFSNCTSLASPPELPATTLANYCYSYMFQNCSNLIIASELPATTLAEYCYSHMFEGCSNLITAPKLPATTMAIRCYDNMFIRCTSLTTAPKLPATTLANYCYGSMFNNCTNLITAPELPATTMANYCYYQMFYYCKNLITISKLSITKLANNCYQNMFTGCLNIKLSTTQTGEYQIPYIISSSDTSIASSSTMKTMFSSTGGTFTGTPEINTTYYLSTSNTVV